MPFFTSKDKNSPMADNEVCWKVYFDIVMGEMDAGRVEMDLYCSTPKTSENFRALCTGEKGKCRRSPRNLHFLNSIFHRVIPGFMA